MQIMHRRTYPNVSILAEGLADYAAEVLSTALVRQEKASLIVPGGSTPRIYLPALAAKALPWRRIAITLSDERWVDTGSPDSNEHLVKTCLLDRLKEQPHFVGLKTSHEQPEAAIQEIQRRLKALPQPFTLTVLGLGEDGHIASLFPGLDLDGIPKIAEYCLVAAPPVAPSLRVSLSLEVLSRSERIALVVTGKTKRQLLDRIENYADPTLPLVWLLQHALSPITVHEVA